MFSTLSILRSSDLQVFDGRIWSTIDLKPFSIGSACAIKSTAVIMSVVEEGSLGLNVWLAAVSHRPRPRLLIRSNWVEMFD